MVKSLAERKTHMIQIKVSRVIYRWLHKRGAKELLRKTPNQVVLGDVLEKFVKESEKEERE